MPPVVDAVADPMFVPAQATGVIPLMLVINGVLWVRV
jgi:hypothetical protein